MLHPSHVGLPASLSLARGDTPREAIEVPETMANPPTPSGGSRRSWSKTPAERGEEFAAHQRKLKAEADERRKNAPPRTPQATTRPRSRRG